MHQETWRRCAALLLPAIALLLAYWNLLGAADYPAGQNGEWEKIVQSAKQEGKVTLYASQAYEEVFREFQKKFPEIKVINVMGHGGSSAQQILSERRAGKLSFPPLVGQFLTSNKL